jgi:hypothetical protein
MSQIAKAPSKTPSSSDPHALRKKCARIHTVLSFRGELVRLQKIRETKYYEGVFGGCDANISKIILLQVLEFVLN